MKYIGNSDTLDEYLAKLSSSEDWLLDGDGEHATYQEYDSKHSELN
jgi:hypothetical protein